MKLKNDVTSEKKAGIRTERGWGTRDAVSVCWIGVLLFVTNNSFDIINLSSELDEKEIEVVR